MAKRKWNLWPDEGPDLLMMALLLFCAATFVVIIGGSVACHFGVDIGLAGAGPCVATN